MQFTLLSLLSFLSVLWVLEAAPILKPGRDAVHIIRYENMQAEDNYKFDFLTSDGQKREETGILVNGGQELLVVGTYSYTGPDNKVYLVEYVADRNGFQPTVSIVGPNNVEEDQQTKNNKQPRPPPQMSTAFGVDPDSAVRPHVLKSLLG